MKFGLLPATPGMQHLYTEGGVPAGTRPVGGITVVDAMAIAVLPTVAAKEANPERAAQVAYDYAEAMCDERERRYGPTTH